MKAKINNLNATMNLNIIDNLMYADTFFAMTKMQYQENLSEKPN